MIEMTLISDEDLATLKIEVLECLEELEGSGGSAAGRFQSKLSNLLQDIDSWQRNEITSQEQISISERQSTETKCKLNVINEKNSKSQHEIEAIKQAIEANNKLSTELEKTTHARNQQVSLFV